MILPLLHIYHAIPSNWRTPLSGALFADGRLRVGIPGVVRDVPEIGHYEHPLGTARVQEFLELVTRQRVWELEGLKRLWPDESIVGFWAGEGESKRTKTWPMSDIPPEVTVVLSAFHRLVDEARASPVRVLAGAARLPETTCFGRTRLNLEFTLRNAGREPIAFTNPMAPFGAMVPLRLLIARPSARPGGSPFAQQRFDVPTACISCPDRPDPRAAGRPGELLELAPGQSLRFAADPALYLSPASYLTALALDLTPGPDASPQALKGVLTMEMQTLQVVPAPA